MQIPIVRVRDFLKLVGSATIAAVLVTGVEFGGYTVAYVVGVCGNITANCFDLCILIPWACPTNRRKLCNHGSTTAEKKVSCNSQS